MLEPWVFSQRLARSYFLARVSVIGRFPHVRRSIRPSRCLNKVASKVFIPRITLQELPQASSPISDTCQVLSVKATRSMFGCDEGAVVLAARNRYAVGG